MEPMKPPKDYSVWIVIVVAFSMLAASIYADVILDWIDKIAVLK